MTLLVRSLAMFAFVAIGSIGAHHVAHAQPVGFDYAGTWLPTAPPAAGLVPVIAFDIRKVAEIPPGVEPRYELRMRYRCGSASCELGPLLSYAANDDNLVFYSARGGLTMPGSIGSCRVIVVLNPQRAPDSLKLLPSPIGYRIAPTRLGTQCVSPIYPFFRERTTGFARREIARRLRDDIPGSP